MKNGDLRSVGLAFALAAALVAACSQTSLMAPPQRQAAQSAPQTTAIDDHAAVEPQQALAPTPKPSPPNIYTGPGNISGLDDQYSPVDGNTDIHQGQPIDGVPCQPTMSNIYHVHVFVGVYVNGTYLATPDTIGLFQPIPEPPSHFTNKAQCYYDVHTHDASGIVHVESTDPKHVPITGSIYTMKQLFDEWGIAVSSTHFGSFQGAVRVITSGQVYRGGRGNGVVYRSTYSQWTGDPNAVPLYSHEAIFYEVGPKYPAVLPNIIYYCEF